MRKRKKNNAQESVSKNIMRDLWSMKKRADVSDLKFSIILYAPKQMYLKTWGECSTGICNVPKPCHPKGLSCFAFKRRSYVVNSFRFLTLSKRIPKKRWNFTKNQILGAPFKSVLRIDKTLPRHLRNTEPFSTAELYFAYASYQW